MRVTIVVIIANEIRVTMVKVVKQHRNSKGCKMFGVLFELFSFRSQMEILEPLGHGHILW